MRILPRRVLALASALLLAGCGWLGEKPRKIRKGSVVRLHYTLEVDGRTADSTYDRKPVEFEEGRGRLIEGLEEQVMGLKAGDEKTVVVPPEKGYGQRASSAVQRLPLERFGPHVWKLKPGVRVQGLRGGRLVSARVVSVADDGVTLDFNHPYAGKVMTFKVKIVDVAASKKARRKR